MPTRQSRRMHVILPALSCAWLLSPATTVVAAEAAQYELDPVHTRVMFAVEHAGFSHAIGTVSGTTGTLVFDPDDWSTARLQASVPLARVDLGDPDWNRAALAGNLLDVADYPVATFVSTRIDLPTVDPGQANGAGADTTALAEPVARTQADTRSDARICGNLSLHGVTREVCLDVTMNALKRHPMPPFRRTAGFSATAHLSRKDFGIDAWPSVIGDSIELRIEAEAIRSGSAVVDEIDEKAPPAEAVHVPPDAPGTTPIAAPQPLPESDLDSDPESEIEIEIKPEDRP